MWTKVVGSGTDVWRYYTITPVSEQAESAFNGRFVLVPRGKKVGERADITDPAWFVLSCLPEICQAALREQAYDGCAHKQKRRTKVRRLLLIALRGEDDTATYTIIDNS